MYQRQLTFGEAVERALKVNYCNFEGRASRSEFWWWMLFTFIVGAVAGFIGNIFGQTFATTLSYIIGAAFLLPNLGIQARRLHDINKSGWWILIALTCVGYFVLLYWYAQESEMRDNQYGPVPNMTN